MVLSLESQPSLGGLVEWGDGEGTAIDFFVIESHMKFVLASTDCCV